jgi:hypothetical protein
MHATASENPWETKHEKQPLFSIRRVVRILGRPEQRFCGLADEPRRVFEQLGGLCVVDVVPATCKGINICPRRVSRPRKR